MRKIHVNGRFLTQPVTGVQRYAIEVVRQWDRWLTENPTAREDWTIDILTPKSGEIHDLGLKSIPVLRRGALTGHVWEQFELPGLSADGVLFCPCNTAPLRSLSGSSPTVVTVHDLSYRYFPNAYSGAFRMWYDILMPTVFKHADRVVTVSQSEKRSMEEQFPKVGSRLSVIQNGCITTDELIEQASQAEVTHGVQGRFILYVGSLSRRKNIQGVLAASAQILERFLDLSVVIVGGSGQNVFAQADVAVPDELAQRFCFLGQVNAPAEISWLYRRAECFLFPSFYEASPLPPMEAMAAGCPVVASAIPSHHERLGDAVLYCNPHDADDIARCVANVLTDEGLARGLVTRGLKRSAEYTWSQCAAETLRVIREVSSPKPEPKRKPGNRRVA